MTAEPIKVPLIVAISGMPKTGKTHLSFTFPEPIAYFEFDIRGSAPVIVKFPDKRIDVFTYPLPIIDTDPPEPYASKLWKSFDEDYKVKVESGDYQTVVLDTSSMIWRVVGHAEAEELGQKKILQRQYYRPNLRMNSLFTRAKMAGVNLVSIQYLADVYLDEKATGEQKSDGWGQVEAAVDIVIWSGRRMIPQKDGKKHVVFEHTIKANRYEPDVDGMTLQNTSYDELYALLGL